MKRPRPRSIRGLALLLAAGLAIGIGGGATYAAFVDTAQNPNNSFDAADDLRPPVIDDTEVEGGGGVAGSIRAGGTYRVYANATDLGSPPSGIASITGDLSNITTGAGSIALTTAGGPWVVNGTGYNWRTAQQTANGGLGSGSVNYAFTLTDTVGNAGNDGPYSVTVDNAAPTVTTTVAQKSQGGVPGHVAQGGTYRVYANLTDPAGVAGATADLSNVTTGATSVAMSTAGGPWTVGGVSYTWRSAQRTANNPLSAGSKSYTISATDLLGNTGSAGTGSVTVDNTAAAASDWQTTNVGGGTAGLPEAGDTATYTFSEQMDPESFLAGWDGSSTAVTARIAQNANNDQFQLWNAGDTVQLPFGFVALGGNYMSGSARSFTGSTMVMGGNTITITLGTPSASLNTVSATTPVWNPSATARDVAWNQMSTATVTQSGAPKVNF